MKPRLWLNKLGWDVGTSEVMKLHDGRLKVTTSHRFAIVESTSDPLQAVELTKANGLLRSDLDAMHPDLAYSHSSKHVL